MVRRSIAPPPAADSGQKDKHPGGLRKHEVAVAANRAIGPFSNPLPQFVEAARHRLVIPERAFIGSASKLVPFGRLPRSSGGSGGSTRAGKGLSVALALALAALAAFAAFGAFVVLAAFGALSSFGSATTLEVVRFLAGFTAGARAADTLALPATPGDLLAAGDPVSAAFGVAPLATALFVLLVLRLVAIGVFSILTRHIP